MEYKFVPYKQDSIEVAGRVIAANMKGVSSYSGTGENKRRSVHSKGRLYETCYGVRRNNLTHRYFKHIFF
jgi:hypothetical protein